MMLKRLLQSKHLRLLAKIALTLLAFWLLFRGVDIAQLVAMLRQQEPCWLIAALLLILCQIMLGALRWRLILTAIAPDSRLALPMRELLRVNYISVFFNCCLPAMVGSDAVRVLLTRSERMPLSVCIHSVIIDRLIALAALAALVVIMLPWLGAILHVDTPSPLPLLALAAALGLWALFRLDRLLKKWEHVRPVSWLLYFIGNLRLLISSPFSAIACVVLAFAAHISFCLAAYTLAQSLGIHITVIQCIALIPLVALATTLPISIGGWGVREAGMVGLLAMLSVPKAAALLLSIQLGLIVTIASLPGGALYACRRKPMLQSA